MLNKSETQDGSVKANKAPGFRAYAAAIYMVIPGCISRLIMAKTKIAPAKLETLPLLELCGAELLVKLTKQILSNVEKQPEQVHFWCDSKVLLDWLDGHPSRWQTFVANRVSFINSSYPNAVWHHVRSAHNAADCATRGLTPAQLAGFTLW
uniref:RNase H type-1 domain-containing protein n=1 Tax=Trichogramma kaykai TaxID=54128 RepID=A0ABD2W1I7_9HYME